MRIDALTVTVLLSVSVPAIAQDLSLDLKEIGLDAGGPPDPPQQRREPQHQLALDRRLGIVIRSDGRFECPVVFGIFHGGNDGFGSQSVRTALRRDWRLPCSVFGPVLLKALRRLASIWRNDVMGR